MRLGLNIYRQQIEQWLVVLFTKSVLELLNYLFCVMDVVINDLLFCIVYRDYLTPPVYIITAQADQALATSWFAQFA